MNGPKLNTVLLALAAAALIANLLVMLSTPVSAIDAKVGSDSAAVAVASSADGAHVYICDGKRCYSSHDSGATFARLKVD